MSLVTDPRDWYPLAWWSWLGRSRSTRWLLRAFLHPDRVCAVRLGHDGLSEMLVSGETRDHPWPTIRDVEYDRTRLRLVTDQGTIEWRIPLLRCAWLFPTIACRLHPEPAPETPIDPETIAAWLGIPVDGQMVVRDMRWLGWLSVAGATLLSGFAVREALTTGEWWNLIIWVAICAQAPFHWRRTGYVVATPYGLRQGRAFVPWADVVHLSRAFTHTAYTRSFQRIELGNSSRSRRVGDTIVEILEARNAGAGPARMDDIPDHALSRAESAEVSAERGISPADGSEA